MARPSTGCGLGEGEWAGECGPELIRATKDGASAVDLIMIPSRVLSRVSIGIGTAGTSVFGETVSPFVSGSSSEILGRCVTVFGSSFEKTLVTGAVISGPSQMGVVILSFSCDGCLEPDALLVTLGPEKELCVERNESTPGALVESLLYLLLPPVPCGLFSLASRSAIRSFSLARSVFHILRSRSKIIFSFSNPSRCASITDLVLSMYSSMLISGPAFLKRIEEACCRGRLLAEDTDGRRGIFCGLAIDCDRLTGEVIVGISEKRTDLL